MRSKKILDCFYIYTRLEQVHYSSHSSPLDFFTLYRHSCKGSDGFFLPHRKFPKNFGQGFNTIRTACGLVHSFYLPCLEETPLMNPMYSFPARTSAWALAQPDSNRFNSAPGMALPPASSGFYRAPMPMVSRQPAQSRNSQNQQPGYYDWSVNNYPVVVQQVNSAATNWVLDAFEKLPWTEIIPSWGDVGRIWLRDTRDRLAAQRKRWVPEDWPQSTRSLGDGVIRQTTGRLV